MLRRSLNALSKLTRKVRRSAATLPAQPSQKVRLFLNPLDARIVPSAAATYNVTSGTLTIDETQANTYATPDTITETGFGQYSITLSSGTFSGGNLTHISNIVFNAEVTNISVQFNTSTGFNTSGNVSINGLATYNALTVVFQDGFNASGVVTVADTGTGSSLDFLAGNDSFGGLTITGGSAVSAPNTFAQIQSDTVHNISAGTSNFSGTLVDLESTQINSATTINLGAGGGVVLTDYTYDNGNPSNDAFNTAATAVSVNGNLSIADLRTRTNDTFQLWNGSVVGSVSINVSGIATEESDINFQQYTIGKNFSASVAVTASYGAYLYAENSTIGGNVTINESGAGADYLYADTNYTQINGSLTVTQGGGYGSEFDAYGGSSGPANSIGGPVTIKQTSGGNYAYIENYSALKSVSITQTGGYEDEIDLDYINAINGSVTVNQSQPCYYDYIEMYNDSVAGAVTVYQASDSGGGGEDSEINLYYDNFNAAVTITQSPQLGGYEANIYAGNDAVKGTLSITQSSGGYNYIDVYNSSLGALTINQSAKVCDESYAYVENSSINSSVSITQAGGSDYQEVEIYGTGTVINGSVTITQSATGYEDYAYIANASPIRGSVTITQASASYDEVDVYSSLITGGITIKQAGGYDNYAYVEYVTTNSSVSVTESAVAEYNEVYIENDSINASVTVNQAAATDEAYVYVEYDTINASVTINMTGSSAGYDAYAYVENDSVNGSVTVNMSGGYYNEVDVYYDTIVGNVSVTLSGALANEHNIYVEDSTINGSITLNSSSGADYSESYLYNDSIKGTVIIKQAGTGYEDYAYIENSSITMGVGIYQGAAEYDTAYIENSSSIGGNVSISQASVFYNDVEVDTSTTIVKSLTINQSAALNYVDIYTSVSLGTLTVNEGAGYNVVDIYDASLGATTLNMGTTGVGYNEVDIGTAGSSSVTFSGVVSVNMGDGTNYVNLATTEPVLFSNGATFTGNASAYSTSDVTSGNVTGTVTFKGSL